MNTTKTWLARGLIALALVGCGTAAPDLCNPFPTSEDATMLPTTRNKTFDTTTPVDPTTLNDLQDCIVGVKHPEIAIPIHPAAFRNEGAAGAGAFIGESWTAAGAGYTIWAPLVLPVGTRVTRIQFGYNRTAGQVGMVLSRSNLDGTLIGGGIEEQVAQFTDTVAAGDVVHEIPAIYHTIQAGCIYAIWMSADAAADAAGAKLRGAVVYVDRL